MNDSKTVINESTYTADKLMQVKKGEVQYNFSYDSLGHKTGTSVGTQNLVTDLINSQTHMLTSSSYGNGTVFTPIYNSDYQLVGKKYNNNLLYEYIYGNMGELIGIKDNVNSIKSSFQYDLSGRLVKTTDDKGNFWQYGYDENSNMNSITKKQFGISEKEGITFDKDNKTTSYSNEISGEKKVDQSIKYDGIARLFSLTTNKDANGSQILKKEYEYQDGTAANTTTTLISKEKTTVTVAGNSTTSTDKEYSYDLKGNITKIKSGDDVIKYSYDNISQLIREENEVTGEVIDYSCDTGGNILSKTVTKNEISKVY